jgi:O-antigen ligase
MPLAPPRRAAEAPVKSLALWTYMAFFLFTFFNVTGLIIVLYKYESLPIQPAAFAAAAIIIYPLTKKKSLPLYFAAAWFFFIAFALGGFLGSQRMGGITDRSLWQLIAKLWINIIGLPLLTLRAISRDKLPMLMKTAVVAAAIGGLFSVVQALRSATFVQILAEPGRGAGFWINPNTCVEVLGFCLFLSLAFPFRAKWMNLTFRAALVIGMLATLSRAGLLIMVLGFLVYGIVTKQLRVILQIGAGLAVVVVIGSIMVGYLSQNTTSKGTARRLERFGSVLRGDVKQEQQDDRIALWKFGWQGVMRDPVFGLGHRTMDNIVPIGTGIGPHNYYLYVWGNSGIVALFAFLALLFVLWRISANCGDTTARAAMTAATAMIAFVALVDHAFLNGQTFGVIFATMVAMAYHLKAEKPIARMPVGVMPPRRPGGAAPMAR